LSESSLLSPALLELPELDDEALLLPMEVEESSLPAVEEEESAELDDRSACELPEASLLQSEFPELPTPSALDDDAS
jgi:hypothetical protein